MPSSKRPSFPFYPGDWRKDPGVQSLSYHDRGVWFEMLLLMHESSERGVLLLNNKPIPESALARLLGLDNQILTTTLTTLLDFAVATKRPLDGAIICRRMVRDEELSKIRKVVGKLGGNPNLVNQISTTQVNQNSTTRVNQISLSSSSSSSSEEKNPPPPKKIEDEKPLDPSIDLKAWGDFDSHRKSTAALRKNWTLLAKRKAQELLAKHSPSEQQAMVDTSIRSGWSGLFPDKKQIKKNNAAETEVNFSDLTPEELKFSEARIKRLEAQVDQDNDDMNP